MQTPGPWEQWLAPHLLRLSHWPLLSVVENEEERNRGMFKNMLLSASLIYELVICTYTFIIGLICIYATAAVQPLYVVFAVHTYITHVYSMFIPVHIVHTKNYLSINMNRYIFYGVVEEREM